MNIHVFSDIVCPWCFVGVERLERVLAETGAPAASLTYHPFILQTDTPPEGINIFDLLQERYGRDPKELFSRAEFAARSSGIPLDLSKQPFIYSSERGHTLLRHAGPRGTQRELARALFRTYFLEAQNISEPDVLVPVATLHGFTADEAAALVGDDGESLASRQDAERARQAGIDGVPFFLFSKEVMISGAQPEETFREAVKQAAAA